MLTVSYSMNTLLRSYKDDPSELNYNALNDRFVEFYNTNVKDPQYTVLKQTESIYKQWRNMRILRHMIKRDCKIVLIGSMCVGCYGFCTKNDIVVNLSIFVGSLLCGKLLSLNKSYVKEEKLYEKIQESILKVVPDNIWNP